MPDVTPCLHPGQVRRWVSFDQHKFSIVAGVLALDGGTPEVCRIETTEKAIRRFIDKQGGPKGLSVCTRRGLAGSRCGDCSRRWGSRAMWSRRR